MLILVLAALGLLVTALITASSLWAWLSIGASALAAVALFLDWLRRRSAQRKAAREAVASDTAEEAGEDTETAVAEGDAEAEAASDGAAAEQPETAEPTPEPATPRHDPHTPPGEEDTDAADLLLVSELDDQVLVIDEQPRYHLPECGWLVDKDTIPIPVSEARELGFTPCARCGPDTSLVARARKKRKRSSGKLGRE
ncbi:hypothetical protein [Haloechinothrix salitolerans]|uniref:hypothetical protein n=1 Tax=Haloechinothrix salitolerans TaxID=926830 RepID=UPI0031EF7FE8